MNITIYNNNEGFYRVLKSFLYKFCISVRILYCKISETILITIICPFTVIHMYTYIKKHINGYVSMLISRTTTLKLVEL